VCEWRNGDSAAERLFVGEIKGGSTVRIKTISVTKNIVSHLSDPAPSRTGVLRILRRMLRLTASQGYYHYTTGSYERAKSEHSMLSDQTSLGGHTTGACQR
jgi:hypothetical protein